MKLDSLLKVLGERANCMTFVCFAMLFAALVDKGIAITLGKTLSAVPYFDVFSTLIIPLVKLINIGFLLLCFCTIACLLVGLSLRLSKSKDSSNTDKNLLRVLDYYIKQSRWVLCIDCLYVFLCIAGTVNLDASLWIVCGFFLSLRNVLAYTYRMIRYEPA